MANILVVDDDQMLREAYALMLSAAGYNVSVACDGADALSQCRALLPDLVLLDMLMPNLDGVGFLEKLQTIPGHKLVKVIIFSNLSTSEKINQAMTLGAEKHITKSKMTPQQLTNEIQEMLIS
jgi:CheY-like chemotaxis protein